MGTLKKNVHDSINDRAAVARRDWGNTAGVELHHQPRD